MCDHEALIPLVLVLHAHFQAILEEQDMLTRLKLVSWLKNASFASGCFAQHGGHFPFAIRQMVSRIVGR